MSTVSVTQNRALALDFLRISLCAGVVLYHYTPVRPCTGPFMVIGFFVLGGFLLGTAFQRMTVLDSAAFFSHKGKRFLPMLAAAMLFSVLGKIYIGKGLPTAADFSWGNFSIPVFMKWYNTPTWYMGVELLLLLAAPLFFFLYHRKNGILLLFISCAAFTCFLFSQVPYAAKFGDGLYFSPVARCWQFVAGILAAQLVSGRYKVAFAPLSLSTVALRKIGGGITLLLSTSYVILWVILAILKQDDDLHLWNYTFAFDTLTTLFFICFIPFLYKAQLPFSSKTVRIVTYTAGLTYPVYLLHHPMYHMAEQVFGRLGVHSNPPAAVCGVLLSILGGMLLLHLQKKFIH